MPLLERQFRRESAVDKRDASVSPASSSLDLRSCSWMSQQAVWIRQQAGKSSHLSSKLQREIMSGCLDVISGIGLTGHS